MEKPPFEKPKVRLFGDTEQAQGYLGAAYNLLFKVRSLAQAAGVPVFGKVLQLSDGAVVQAATIRGIDTVSVYPPGVDQVEPDEEAPEVPVGLYPGFVAFPRNTANPNGATEVNGESVSPDLLVEISPGGKRWRFKPNTTVPAGTVTWFDPDGNLLSYNHGGPSRYHFPVNNIPYPKADIYYRGLTIKTPANQGVMGVGIYRGRLIVITRQISPIVAYECTVRSTRLSMDDLKAHVAAKTSEITPEWTTVGYVSLPTSSHYFVGWFFKPDGSEAQAIGYHSDRTFQRRKLAFSINPDTGAVEQTATSPAYSPVYQVPAWTVTSGSGTAANHTISYPGDRRWLMVDYDLDGNEVIAEHITDAAEGTSTYTVTEDFSGTVDLTDGAYSRYRGPATKYFTRVTSYSRSERFVVNGEVLFTTSAACSFTHQSIMYGADAYKWDGGPLATPLSLFVQTPAQVLTYTTSLSGGGTEDTVVIQDLDLRFKRVLVAKETRNYTTVNNSVARGTYYLDASTNSNATPYVTNTTTPGGNFVGAFAHQRSHTGTRHFGVAWGDFLFDAEPQQRTENVTISPSAPHGGAALSITYRADPGGFSSAPLGVVFSCRSPKTFLSLLRVHTSDGGEYHRLYVNGQKAPLAGKVPFIGTTGFNAYPVRTI